MNIQHSFDVPHNEGTLYLVPTPIGNLEDMTFRAINILKSVNLIASEDTRNTQKLLNHFEIETKQISFHEHNSQAKIPELIEKLSTGISIAQVSDAGMPSISDPGHDLVKACIDHDIPVVPLPGANAGLTSLIASGIAPQPFQFYGFLPRKPKEQKNVLQELINEPESLIFYEAPHRLKKTLENMLTVLGEHRKISVCRELTKRHEEFIRGTLGEINDWAKENEIRGEFVLIVEGNSNPKKADSTLESQLKEMPINEQVDFFIKNNNLSVNEAIKKVAKLNDTKKQVIYNEYHDLN
ncbi:16S rRNA (cytidine(1402)-2'-O)-methyltransferase [Lentilactobacillus laojiaonis]|uniref:16S rRNA (cytidine(1402)-2'-O)-methyltransferase n=1 Tax=Lentilactobacillus laojiaonis TaxID=2883998 RepID=UPI001D0B9C8F|nr:16S rRNA (cytidine(1402)-2'-O)-methyltransferase [Lentilactobacillus laojiaonis]UDM31850.1 16S rRNA (cytidine(1402)-2'-O)-methyltransferase [Lentilactobacillus laojiaonis]